MGYMQKKKNNNNQPENWPMMPEVARFYLLTTLVQTLDFAKPEHHQ